MRRSTRSICACDRADRAGRTCRSGSGFGRESTPGGALAWTNWIAGIVAVYSTLFGIGKIIFGEMGTGLVLLAIAVVAFAWIARSFRNETPPPAMRWPVRSA